MNVYDNILQMIGKTPLLKVNQLNTGLCQLYLKLENQNPGGSLKDRIGLNMITRAEERGDLKPGATIVEATAGNTGVGLALVAIQKGYKLVIVMPDKMSREKIVHMKAFGAQVIMTRSDVEKGHPEYYQDLAESIAAKIPGAYYINQFANPDNVEAHERTTGPEIWQQLEKNVDAFVHGIGTSGTMTGVARYLKSVNPNIQMVLADPKGSVLTQYIKTGHMPPAGKWLVEGIGEDFVPSIADLSLIDDAITIDDKEAFQTARQLLMKEGVFAGSSTGTIVAAALRYCQQQTQPKRVVALVCDGGAKYLSKVYNDTWLANQGLIEKQTFGDLRDIIAKFAHQHEVIAIKPNEPLSTALSRMMNNSVSQLTVMEQGRVVGLVTETDLLAAVAQQQKSFQQPVVEIMQTQLNFLPAESSLQQLMNVFTQHQVALITHQNEFQGLISRIDLINYLALNEAIHG